MRREKIGKHKLLVLISSSGQIIHAFNVTISVRFFNFFMFFIMFLFSAGVDWAVDYLMNIVKGEEKHGIQADRVMIGGFSQVFKQIES